MFISPTTVLRRSLCHIFPEWSGQCHTSIDGRASDVLRVSPRPRHQPISVYHTQSHPCPASKLHQNIWHSHNSKLHQARLQSWYDRLEAYIMLNMLSMLMMNYSKPLRLHLFWENYYQDIHWFKDLLIWGRRVINFSAHTPSLSMSLCLWAKFYLGKNSRMGL